MPSPMKRVVSFSLYSYSMRLRTRRSMTFGVQSGSLSPYAVKFANINSKKYSLKTSHLIGK